MTAAKRTKTFRIGEITVGGGSPLFLIAGPCVIESESRVLKIARLLKELSLEHEIPLVFKASYDKANRSSIDSYRGPGIVKGLKILSKVKERFGLPILTDVHCRGDVAAAARVADILQIPAFLSRQTDMIVAVAKSGKVVNIKKGQFLAPWDIKHAIEKTEMSGNEKIMLTERGVSFGYNNLVNDMRALVIMRDYGYPVVYDATHSVQLPGGMGNRSGGDRRFVPALSRAAVATGCDGLFLEVHEEPDKALCDGPNSVALKDLSSLLASVKKIDAVVKNREEKVCCKKERS
ncbi:MAG TPA: 3-deoxy-8-phosphooctulonate synthase [bacterium]|nr:3-deoxy-8-phosphooctulonate synthase [bacterium]